MRTFLHLSLLLLLGLSRPTVATRIPSFFLTGHGISSRGGIRRLQQYHQQRDCLTRPLQLQQQPLILTSTTTSRRRRRDLVPRPLLGNDDNVDNESDESLKQSLKRIVEWLPEENPRFILHDSEEEDDDDEGDLLALLNEQEEEELIPVEDLQRLMTDLVSDDDDENEEELFLLDKDEAERMPSTTTATTTTTTTTPPVSLETALLEGVVPANAGVGSGLLIGDYGFDPLGLSKRDLFQPLQTYLVRLLQPLQVWNVVDDDRPLPRPDEPPPPRPPALLLRDYAEAEIRHGRLAMLAAIVWPLQELTDRLLVVDVEHHPPGNMVYGGWTLPYLSILMMAILLLLGYLDVYADSIKAAYAGEAFLPGECFWDPLQILEGATPETKRRMQERELANGRAAMVAVAAYGIQEAWTHQAVVTLPWNVVLFEPAFQIPAVRHFLDASFE